LGSSHADFNDLPKVIRERNVEGVLLIGQTLPKVVKQLRASGFADRGHSVLRSSTAAPRAR
jgi:hypothetical protein